MLLLYLLLNRLSGGISSKETIDIEKVCFPLLGRLLLLCRRWLFTKGWRAHAASSRSCGGFPVVVSPGKVIVAIVILMPEGIVPGSVRLWRLAWRKLSAPAKPAAAEGQS